MSRRLTRHEMLQQDEFVSRVEQILGWARDNARRLAIGFATLLAVVIGIGGGMAYLGGRSEHADAALAQAMAELRAPVAEEGGSAPEGSAEPFYATARERDEALLPQLEALIRDYPRSKAAVTSGYLHGAALLRLGRLEEARVSLDSFLARHPDSDLAASARRTLARVEISAGQPEAAIAHLTGLAEHPSSLAPADAVLMDLGAAQELAGETEAAAKSYQRVITDFPQSSFAAEAGRAVTRLGVPGKTTS